MMAIDDNTYMFKVAKYGPPTSVVTIASAYVLLDRNEGDTTSVAIETRVSLFLYIVYAGLIALMALGPFVGEKGRSTSIESLWPTLLFFFAGEFIIWVWMAFNRFAAVSVVRGLLKDSSL